MEHRSLWRASIENGKRATLAIGDFQTDLKHAALGRDKNMVMLTFAHGEIAVRDFRMTSSANSVAKPASADDANSRSVKPDQQANLLKDPCDCADSLDQSRCPGLGSCGSRL